VQGLQLSERGRIIALQLASVAAMRQQSIEQWAETMQRLERIDAELAAADAEQARRDAERAEHERRMAEQRAELERQQQEQARASAAHRRRACGAGATAAGD
jgi:hypothetical protein